MTVNSGANNAFEKHLEKAVNALQAKDYAAAQQYIEYAMLENAHAPQVHNLLGILAELAGDLSLAGKHYRAAYALDPAYKPAGRNLERITSFAYKPGNENPDFGDQSEAEEIIPYSLEDDDNNIGHLRKKEQ